MLRHALEEAQPRRAEGSTLLEASRVLLERREFRDMARAIFDRCTVAPSLPMPMRGLRAEAIRAGRAVYHNLAGIERVLSTGEARVIGKTVECVGLRRDGSEFPIELSLSMTR